MTPRPDLPVMCPTCHHDKFSVVKDREAGVVSVLCSACRHPLLRVAEEPAK